jgi:hypothetical protein
MAHMNLDSWTHEAFIFAMPIRTVLILLLLAALSCGCDAPASKGHVAGSSSAGAAGTAAGCPGLGEHWREVWTAEAAPGLERRRTYVITRVTAMWANACASVAKEPAEDLSPVLTELRAVRNFAGIEGLSQSGGTATKQKLVKSAQEAVIRTKSAYAVAASGVDDCEEAIASAAFCGDDVDKASVKSAASGKDEGACVALSALLAKKCAQQ